VRPLVFALFGLVFGSFLTVAVHRIPRGESVVTPRSRCPRCGTAIPTRHNIPVLSYVLLRGRCHRCGEPISLEYPLTEVATAVLFGAAGALVEPLYAAILMAGFLAIMLALALVDARWRVIPNRVVYPAVAVYLVALTVGHFTGGGVDVLRGLIGLAAYAVPLFLLAVAVPGGMGMGDVKLAALIGLVVGSRGLSLVAVAAFVGIVGGGVAAVLAMAILGWGRKRQMPFGPFLAAGGVVAVLFGPPIAAAYLSLLP
jgi:leader peptidase (prepilin peptidase) / N-methyltransferase